VSKLLIALVAGTSALFATGASAAPLYPETTRIDNGIENVRMVCDQFGRCWRARGERRMIQRESYGYDRGYGQGYGYDQGRPHYNSYNSYNTAPGIGVQLPGVSIGVGGGRW